MRTAIVVPGNGRVEADGIYRITDACRALVVEAERLAREHDVAAVVFTGWSPSGGPSEAEQMRDAWAGPEVELVVEPTATNTAENAARTVPLLAERGVERALVVCTPVHRKRARFFFRRLYGRQGIEATVVAARVPVSLRALAWEVAAFSIRRAQLRMVEQELRR
jgi:uncharacterized SAM-binding protein YcdF (DUF218 family)